MRLLKRLGQVLGILTALLVVAGCATGLWVWSELRGSLPRSSGRAEVSGLVSDVRIERDALGVPRITAKSEADAAAALGWLHGQERFFQMDLMRRRAAGELSALAGAATVEMDKGARIHRFRWRAQRALAAVPAAERAVLDAYTMGVNAGLAALRAKPIEYVMLRGKPEPWRAEDSFLVVFNMFLELQDDTGYPETTIRTLHRCLAPAMADFLSPTGTEWDAPIVGQPDAGRGPEIPAAAWAPGGGVAPTHAASEVGVDGPVLGSNNWAVSGAHMADGHAWLANDMHLGLQLPNTWYRAELRWGDVRVTGVTLPGAPGVVVGSNGHVAWGFTNSYGDWSDVVPVAAEDIEERTEQVVVHGGKSVAFKVQETRWGPIVAVEPEGQKLALRWTAHDTDAVNLHLFRMARARTLDEALLVAASSGIPAQNLVAVDSAGHLGWTICGRIPRRTGTADWQGYLEPSEYPKVVDPPSGRIWTANARVVDGEMLAVIGDGGYALGARARQIRDDLMKLERATPRDLLHVQLDDRAVFFERWQKLLLDQLTPEAVAGKPLRAEARSLVERWGGRASVDSVGFRIARGFRSTVSRDVWNALTAPCRAADGTFRGPLWQFEGPLWKLVAEKRMPAPSSGGWDAFLLDALDRTLADMTKDGTPLAQATWGKRNTVRVGHPLAQGMPALSRWLDMPALELPGADHMPRVQSPTEGASERMVVSPGLEAQSFFHMPGGQSGHPSSPHYGDGHAAWAKGEPTPFLPGPAVDVLMLAPAK